MTHDYHSLTISSLLSTCTQFSFGSTLLYHIQNMLALIHHSCEITQIG